MWIVGKTYKYKIVQMLCCRQNKTKFLTYIRTIQSVFFYRLLSMLMMWASPVMRIWMWRLFNLKKNSSGSSRSKLRWWIWNIEGRWREAYSICISKHPECHIWCDSGIAEIWFENIDKPVCFVVLHRDFLPMSHYWNKNLELPSPLVKTVLRPAPTPEVNSSITKTQWHMTSLWSSSLTTQAFMNSGWPLTLTWDLCSCRNLALELEIRLWITLR